MTCIEARGVRKAYGATVALDGMDLRVEEGRILGLIGPNGAGKSTLFDCLAGVLPADGGMVRAGGREIGLRERPGLLFYMPDGIAPWPAQPVQWALDYTLGFFSGRAELRAEMI